MSANRPSRRDRVLIQFITLLLVATAALSGQEFVLPDIILSNLSRPDVSQPEIYPDAAELWNAELPAFRRQYSIPVVDSIDLKKVVPGNSPAGSTVSLFIIPGNVRGAGTSSVPLQFYNMAAGTDINLREGADAFLKITIPEFGVLGGILFVPFSNSGPRPWSGEVNWARIGNLSADVRIGVKDDIEITPYGTARLSWNGGILRPDTYFLNLHAYGFSDFAFSADTGTDLALNFTGSDWSLQSKIEGGGWYSNENNNGFIRAALAAGYQLPGLGLSLKAGADTVFSGMRGWMGSPFIRIHWQSASGVSIFADSGFIVGFPESVDSVLRREKINGFNPETPVHARYRLGFIRDESNMVFFRMDVSYGYGFFSEGINGSITTDEDKRIYGSASMGYNLGSQRIELSGSWDASLTGKTDIWESRMVYSLESMAFYISGGTEDALLASYFPGVRGETPIIGIGFDWDINENWDLSSFAYAAMPWEVPSLTFSIEWRK